MAQITVKISGPSRDARFDWDGAQVGLANAGNVYTADFSAPEGSHDYQMMVWGAPGEKWTATVSGGIATNSHQGHMSSANGSDGTPDVPYAV